MHLFLSNSFDRITSNNDAKQPTLFISYSSELEHLKETDEYKSLVGDLYIDF